MLTIAHITHEATDHIGGIGTVLEGLLTSPVYQANVRRSILVGPFAGHIEVEPARRLGESGQVLYSTVDGIDAVGLAGKMHPIEWAFNVAIIYGRRTFSVPGDLRSGEADVLLIDVFRTNPDRLALFKLRLNETFGIDSRRYESSWGYEEYVRLAEPAFYGLLALLDQAELPCLMLSHEFMGLPAAFKATLDGQRQFRTIFYAHECGTARQIVENHPGHDTMFYNVLREARRAGLYVQDVFGDLSGSFRHALVAQSHLCDGIVAVGEYTAQEIHFLGPHFDHHHIDVVHNGIPAMKVKAGDRVASRLMLTDCAAALVGFRPDVLMTHVTRPVISKAIWRDFAVCGQLDRLLGSAGRTGVLLILTSAGGIRRRQDVEGMAREYEWPRNHREGYPDLVGPELEFDRMVRSFNEAHRAVQVVLVNQFGWSRRRMGDRVPEGMTMADLRRGTDVEFGMACYEPFGISPLEPLGSGAVCVMSNVCGCAGFVTEAAGGQAIDNALVADFTKLESPMDIGQLLTLGQPQRDAIEQRVAAEVAAELMRRLSGDEGGRMRLLATGQALVRELGWDHVLQEHLIPMMHRVLRHDEPAGRT